MPITATYPGVYIEEIPSGVHTITGVGTSVAAFIDMFKEGPMNEAVLVTSLAEFNRIFGGLDSRSEASYAIQQFFLNGGSQAYIVRVAAGAADSTPLLGKASVTIAGGAGQILKVVAKSEGAWGNNLRVDINRNTENPFEKFNLIVTRFSSQDGTARPLLSETYLNISMNKADSRYAVDVVNNASMLIKLERVSADDNFSPPGVTGLVSGDLRGFTSLDADRYIEVTLGGVTKRIKISAESVTSLSVLRDKLQAAIRFACHSPSFTEARVDLFTVVNGATTAQYLRILSGRKGIGYSPLEIIQIDNDSAVIGDSTATDLLLTTADDLCSSNNPQEYVLGCTVLPEHTDMVACEVGGDGSIPGAAEIIGQRALEPFTGMYALEAADLFNILSIPLAADLADNEMDSVVSSGLAYCKERRAVMIIDIPSGIDTVSAMKEWMDNKAAYRDKDAVLYFPRLQIPDPLNTHRPRNVAASGTMAGVFARIDSSRGVWKAPAGTEAKLQGVSKLIIQRDMTDAQNGILNPLGINCLRTFPLYGITSWGARTLDGADALASEWKYIPIRRLALFLEESLYRGTRWVVFEPNDEPLWAKIRMNIGTFMMRLFRQGAFQGSTPDKAFFVKCDSETTPQSDRNLGIVNIEVGFAPLKPAEFVIIRIQQMAGEL